MPPLKLKITLEKMPHPVTRKLLVPEDVNMRQLHLLIQVAMGWENYHMWEFTDAKWKGKIRVSLPQEDDFGFEKPRIAHQVSLKETFVEENGGKPFWYLYDFGDDWWHKISFLKTNAKDRERWEGAPLCTEAIGGCPPEDCGGPWGYEAFLETISDPRHEDYEEMREWAGLEEGDKWPTEAPPIEFINQELNGLYKGKGWKGKGYGML